MALLELTRLACMSLQELNQCLRQAGFGHDDQHYIKFAGARCLVALVAAHPNPARRQEDIAAALEVYPHTLISRTGLHGMQHATSNRAEPLLMTLHNRAGFWDRVPTAGHGQPPECSEVPGVGRWAGGRWRPLRALYSIQDVEGNYRSLDALFNRGYRPDLSERRRQASLLCVPLQPRCIDARFSHLREPGRMLCRVSLEAVLNACFVAFGDEFLYRAEANSARVVVYRSEQFHHVRGTLCDVCDVSYADALRAMNHIEFKELLRHHASR